VGVPSTDRDQQWWWERFLVTNPWLRRGRFERRDLALKGKGSATAVLVLTR
jgi:hypothetical protein